MKLCRLALIAVLFLIPTAAMTAQDVGEAAYQNASKCYHDVKQLPADQKSRAKWHKCANLFEQFAKKYSKSKRADDALFSAGLSYRRIYEVTDSQDDARTAIKKFNELNRMYAKSNLADDALFNIATLKWEALEDKRGSERALHRIISWHPDGDMAGVASNYLKKIDGSAPRIVRKNKKSFKDVRIKSIEKRVGDGDERVILKLSGPAQFRESQAKHNIPSFLKYTVELDRTQLSRMLDLGYSYVGKGIIRDISPLQVDRDTTQVSIVIKDGHHCAARSKSSTMEIVCAAGAKVKEPVITVAALPKTEEVVNTTPTIDPTEAIEEAPAPKPLVVVIDAGHGGEDEGAVGKKGTKEKDIVLQIAKRLGWQLRNKYGMDVNYTRIEDRTLSLDDRNTIASGFDADLFISIHANAAESSKLDGYQTFFLNNATDDASRRLAARENVSVGKSMDDLEQIILTMMQNANTDESRQLAKSIHKKVLSDMSKYALKDRGVRSALFYVLVGAKCPAVLIETSFISNPEEEKKLKDPDYQENIVKAISSGVGDFLVKKKRLKSNL
jgi:N-acetylmuramoyl-L-alanine amidase